MNEYERRFWSKVDKRDPNECWEWQAGVTQEGYPIVWDGNQTVYAYRYLWELMNGSIQEGRYVHRRCDNKRCMNPKHLYLSGPKDSMEKRFWSKVDKGNEDDCWEWQAGDIKGYGDFRYKESHILAHRLSWELTNGSVPEGICVLHHCDNPKCVNPAHLFLGTRADNIADMMEKGRYAKGERKGSAKLTKREVLTIRRRWTTEDVTQTELAKDHHVDPSTISLIVNHKTWTHI